VKCGHLRTGGGVKDIAEVHKLVLVYCTSVFCGRFLWVMPKYKSKIVSHLVLFVAQNIIWVGMAYIGLAPRLRLFTSTLC